MTKIQLTIYGIALMAIILLISYLMEIYKKDIRKGKASKRENMIVAFILSSLGVLCLYLAHILKPVLGLIGAPLWADAIAYTVVFYIAQFELSMKVVKKITKHFVVDFLEDHGFSSEDIKNITDVK